MIDTARLVFVVQGRTGFGGNTLGVPWLGVADQYITGQIRMIERLGARRVMLHMPGGDHAVMPARQDLIVSARFAEALARLRHWCDELIVYTGTHSFTYAGGAWPERRERERFSLVRGLLEEWAWWRDRLGATGLALDALAGMQGPEAADILRDLRARAPGAALWCEAIPIRGDNKFLRDTTPCLALDQFFWHNRRRTQHRRSHRETIVGVVGQPVTGSRAADIETLQGRGHTVALWNDAWKRAAIEAMEAES